MQALISGITLATVLVTFINTLRTGRKVTETRDLVNGQHQETINRVDQLTASLTAADVAVPPDPRSD